MGCIRPPCLDGPEDSVWDARLLQALNMLAEGGTLGILVLHVEGVAPVPVFEGRLAEPSVGLLGDDGQGRGGLLLGGRHLCLIYYAWGQAVPPFNQSQAELVHVGHRPVGCINGVPVEAPEEVTDQEALVDELQEGASNISLRLLGEG